MSNKIKKAMKTLRKAMKDTKPGSYAHGWHCNIAVHIFDTLIEDNQKLKYRQAHKLSNKAASRVMKAAFNVTTKN